MSLPFTEIFIRFISEKAKQKTNVKLKVLNNLVIKTNEYMRDKKLETKDGFAILHQKRGMDWTSDKNQRFFDSCGCLPPKLFSNKNIGKNGKYVFFQIRKSK